VNLQEALLELREKDHLIGTFKELINHLRSFEDGEGKIPIHNSTEEFVDEGYITEVREMMETQVSGLLEERKRILGWSVDSVREDQTEAGESEG